MKQLTLLGMAFCTALVSREAAAQGCTPIRFTTPIDLGGEGQAYQRAHQWQFTLAYRRLHSNQFFMDSSQDPSRSFSLPSGLGESAGPLHFEARARREATGRRSNAFNISPGQQVLWTIGEGGSGTVTRR